MPGRSLVVAPRQPGYDNQNLPVCETLYGDSNAVTPPYYAYRHSDHVIPSESCPVGGSSIAGLSFSAPSPQQLRGKQVFRTWSDGVTTATHPPITAPAGPASYTATFAKR
jgi:hypothetical protein